MSPSRIPRQGATPPSPLGPGRNKASDTTPTIPTSPVVPSSMEACQQSKTGGPKAPSRLPQTCSPNIPKSPKILSSAPQGSPSSLPVPKSRRRPKPPSDEELPPPRRHTSAPTPQSPKRRPVPQLGSDVDTGIPRLGIGPRKVLRQPASSVNLSANILGDIPRPVGRNRAKSAAASTSQPKLANALAGLNSRSASEQQPEMEVVPMKSQTFLFESSFLDSREPSVPAHIASRLKLIHQLGVVLGVDAKVLQGSIDIPGLLRRVDVAYEKGFGAYSPGDESVGLGRRGSSASASGLPIPTPLTSSASRQGRISMDVNDARISVDERPSSASANVGVTKRFGMWKPFSRKRSADTLAAPSPDLTPLMTNDDDVLDRSARRTNQWKRSLASRRFTKYSEGADKEAITDEHAPTGPVFGTSLTDAPDGSWCTSLIGGHRHDLPLVLFTIVEEIYRRGMSQPGIFRLAGDGSRLAQLIDTYNSAPLYGDTLALDTEPIHNLTGLVKRYVRDLPEAILDEAIFPALMSFCAAVPIGPSPDESEGSAGSPFTEETRIAAAQILLQLLPPPHFSLLMYLLAFLGQLPLFPDNRLNIDSISIIFGPAICAPRGKGISGLGPSPVGRGSDACEAERISALVDDSQAILAWLLRNWTRISEKILDPTKEPVDRLDAGSSDGSPYDPRLLSPIDLRGQASEDSPYAKGKVKAVSPVQASSPTAPSTSSVLGTPPDRWSSMGVVSPEVVSAKHSQPNRPRSSTSSISPSPSVGLGLFHRARSSSNLQTAHRGSMFEPGSGSMLGAGKAKRSASFTSLSSLLKMGASKSGSNNIQPKRFGGGSDSNIRSPTPLTSPQVHSVLDSLHDLLISKDKQIERDARELALLRHTLLEMDEKLQRMSTSPEPGGGGSYLSSLRAPASTAMSPRTSAGSQPSAYSACSSTPSILVTSSTSSHQISPQKAPVSEFDTVEKDRQLAQLQDQLNSTVALLDAARVQNRDIQGRLYEMESRLAMCEAERKAEMGQVEVQLSIERTRVRGLIEERDLARDRLDKVKSTLLAVG